MLRSLSALVAGKLGFRPNGLRMFGAVMALALVVFVPAMEMSRGVWLVDLLDSFHLALATVMVVLAVFLLWPLGRSYVIENGELSYVSRRGRVLWREDLRGLEYVTCSSGGARSTIMTLRWPDRRRRIELFESLERALCGSDDP